MFPLKNYSLDIPEGDHPGSFGFIRKFDIHTGIDLYCEENQEVFAIEDGVVLKVIKFTGPDVGSPWWNDTYAIFIKGKSGIILYGEISVSADVKAGSVISEGQLLGNVTRVLKTDKGRPMDMLHVELYNKEVDDAVIWGLDSMKPESLEDPTALLKKAKG